MRKLLINTLIVMLVFCTSLNTAYAKNKVKMRAEIDNEFTIKNQELPDIISLKTTIVQTLPNEIIIPENSLMTLQVIRAQRELRWHKSGLILCKLVSYMPEGIDIPIDVSDKDLYLMVRKYEAINKKEAWILGTEIVITQGASFFAPGVDIGYFFIKGAIQREKHPNWFKAGVRNAYDNSIFWFPQKGKPIELKSGAVVQIKDINSNKVIKTVEKIDTRNARFERQAAKRIARHENKAFKRELKQQKHLVDCSVVEDVVDNVNVERSVLAEIVSKNMVDETSK